MLNMPVAVSKTAKRLTHQRFHWRGFGQFGGCILKLLGTNNFRIRRALLATFTVFSITFLFNSASFSSEAKQDYDNPSNWSLTEGIINLSTLLASFVSSRESSDLPTLTLDGAILNVDTPPRNLATLRLKQLNLKSGAKIVTN